MELIRDLADASHDNTYRPLFFHSLIIAANVPVVGFLSVFLSHSPIFFPHPAFCLCCRLSVWKVPAPQVQLCSPSVSTHVLKSGRVLQPEPVRREGALAMYDDDLGFMASYPPLPGSGAATHPGPSIPSRPSRTSVQSTEDFPPLSASTSAPTPARRSRCVPLPGAGPLAASLGS
jgi:hypothetical protein